MKTILIPLAVVLGVASVITLAARSPVSRLPFAVSPAIGDDLQDTVERINGYFADRWEANGMTPAEPADELQTLRRLSLSLHGTVPSLEEIRQFEADQQPDRLTRWTSRMLADVRYTDYFSTRLARSFVGADDGQFVLFRRDRFTEWLGNQLEQSDPPAGYDDIVRSMIAETGLWTDKPATNYVTAALANGDIDENKLAGRAVRIFLGQRIDCAQCHDHPFDHWKQQDFEGLASFFGQTQVSIVGIEDKSKLKYEIEDSETLEKREVDIRVPFHPEWLPAEGTRRERLAAWITHPENRRFERAAANRVWGLMFGRPYINPVDDLPDPGDPAEPDILDILGADFREHDYDLKRMIHVIAALRVFRAASDHPADDPETIAHLEDEWAVFPLVRLRPEQIIGAMLQAASVKTIDQNSHLIFRTIKFFQSQNFVKEYGDLGENELEMRAGTIPQALLRMNGELTQETTKGTPFSASGRIAGFASTDERCLEVCFLTCLSRRPTTQEQEHFLPQLQGTEGDRRSGVVTDIFWALYNSPEFSWNH